MLEIPLTWVWGFCGFWTGALWLIAFVAGTYFVIVQVEKKKNDKKITAGNTKPAIDSGGVSNGSNDY